MNTGWRSRQHCSKLIRKPKQATAFPPEHAVCLLVKRRTYIAILACCCTSSCTHRWRRVRNRSAPPAWPPLAESLLRATMCRIPPPAHWSAWSRSATECDAARRTPDTTRTDQAHWINKHTSKNTHAAHNSTRIADGDEHTCGWTAAVGFGGSSDETKRNGGAAATEPARWRD